MTNDNTDEKTDLAVTKKDFYGRIDIPETFANQESYESHINKTIADIKIVIDNPDKKNTAFLRKTVIDQIVNKKIPGSETYLIDLDALLGQAENPTLPDQNKIKDYISGVISFLEGKLNVAHPKNTYPLSDPLPEKVKEVKNNPYTIDNHIF